MALVVSETGYARGVTPYLPLNLEPEIESQIERVLVLGDQPVLTRPIPAATVLEALPKACKVDEALCSRVRKYLARFMGNHGITHASVEGAASSGNGKGTVEPNRYGMTENSHWDASAQIYWQPSDYVLVDLGAVGYEGHTSYTGSLISLGWSFAQLDLGFRPHWFSPMSDSSLLMSTEAATLPSFTLSNYRPFTRFGLHYELFAGVMSQTPNIVYGDQLTSGHPRLAGIHLEAQPASGWALGFSRLTQYGGGARGGGSLSDLQHAWLNPSSFDNNSPPGSPGAAANQEASITSTLIFPGKVPFNLYVEYGGEDTSRGKSYLLGNSALSMGVHFPRLWQRFDFTYEISEWQNSWYTHTTYLDGLVNYRRVVGSWFGDQRVYNDGVGGRSQMARLGWTPPFGGLVELKYRTLQNQQYTHNDYSRYHDLMVGYSREMLGAVVGGQLETGRDVFGGNFNRLSGFVRYAGSPFTGPQFGGAAGEDDGGSPIRNGEVFVDIGGNINRINVDLTAAATRKTGPTHYGPHLAVGARRFVSDHSDLGLRVEIDQVQSHNLLGVRILDYRYRFAGPLALDVFLGAARYNLETPAYGLYYGAGLQWRNVLPKWDVGIDYRYANSVARDHLLPTDPPNAGDRNDSFYNISSVTLAISRHF